MTMQQTPSRPSVSAEATLLLERALRDMVRDAPHSGSVAVTGSGPLPDLLCQVLRQVVATVLTGEEQIGLVEQSLTRDTALLPDVVILPCRDGVSPYAYGRWQRGRLPHLPVVVTGDRVIVGPLVRPGRAGPCLRCLDLHRTDRDPSWPMAAARLESTWPLPGPVTAPAELSSLAAGLVALVVRGLAGGDPLPAGLCLSATTPQPRVRHHLWSAHPSCDCWRETLVQPSEADGPQ